MFDCVKNHLLKTYPIIEYGDGTFYCKDVIEKAETKKDKQSICIVFMSLFNSLYGGEEYEIATDFSNNLYIDTYNYCLVIKDIYPEVYPFYMGHLLLHMPDEETLDLSMLKGIEPDFKKRIKYSLKLLKLAKIDGAPVDEDIKLANDLINFYGF